MRRILEFRLNDLKLCATLDEGDLQSGLLIVSGGNEIRSGAHRGMASLAQAVAAEGYPVFRFDRRGIGDSEGENGGYEASAPDTMAALSAFRAAAPRLERIVAFGNCDAATALLLHRVKVDALVLANPWLIEQRDALPPRAAIKARYARRLRDPAAWLALATGKLNIRSVISGLRRIAGRGSTHNALADMVAARLTVSKLPTTIIVADGDNTGIAFADAWHSAKFDAARSRRNVKYVTLASSSHSFAQQADFDFLLGHLIDALSQ